MDRSSDSEVLSAAADWLVTCDAVTLVTVVESWGSSPRPPGAVMAIHPDGRFAGSVSGGCVEDELVQKVLRGELPSGLPQLLEYGVSTEQAQQLGLPCGGRLSLMVERIETPSPLRALLNSMASGQLIARHVCVKTGEASLRPASTNHEFLFDGDNIVKVYGPRWRMLIVGAGELGRRVAQLALTLDYAVLLCDPRPEYAQGWQLEGTEFITTAPAQAVARLHPDPRTVILALSHTPALDDEALHAALQSDAFYVGALGSRNNQQARCRRLREQGLSPDALARLHGPVGLDIGSRTPAEISVAIVAALIAERSRQQRDSAPAQAAHG